MESESETLMLENPVAYWQLRSKRALKSRGVFLPRRRDQFLPRVPPAALFRRPVSRHRPLELPGRLVNFRRSFIRLGIDLICNSCGGHIPKSKRLFVRRYFFPRDGPEGSPHSRCFLRCMNCSADLVLGRNNGSDVETLVVISGATQHFPANDFKPRNEISLDAPVNEVSADDDRVNEVYPEDEVSSDYDLVNELYPENEVSSDDPLDSDDDSHAQELEDPYVALSLTPCVPKSSES